ncbi:MAG: ATP cone domain-containing protein, partial [Anaerolineales bacterium]
EYLEQTLPEDHTPHIEEIQDAVEKVLIENGHAKVAKAYILYRDEQAKRRMDRGRRAAQSAENIPWRKLWYVLDWAVENDLHTIEALNRRIRNDEFPQIVHQSEAAYEDDVDTAAELLSDRADSLKVVIISGPSSSGKTTTTIKIEHRLSERGLKFRPINIDNYFFDLEMHPKDEFGDYDFETPQALDLPLINEHLKALVSGEEVLIPFYDFKTGTRTLEQTPMQLKQDEILLIDSLHGLYPPMTEGIADEVKGKIYIEPLLQVKDQQGEYVHWADLRMIRRMLRDAEHRAYDPQRTLEHWHYVRSSELRHIIPNIHNADIVINSAMPYELPIYSARLLDSFEDWTKKYEDDPVRQDAFMRASRMYSVLKTVEPVDDESPIPPESVIREFIGGSTLKY